MGARAGAVGRRSGGGGRTSLLSGLVLNEEFASPFFIPKQLTTPALSPTTTFCVERFDIGSSLSVFLLVDATCKRSQRESESSIGGAGGGARRPWDSRHVCYSALYSSGHFRALIIATVRAHISGLSHSFSDVHLWVPS